VFPFTFGRRIHTTCTTMDGDETPWCSTKVDSSGEHVSGGGFWEHCQAGCPGVSLPEMSVDPRNAVGAPCVCGVSNPKDRAHRIVGGEETEVGELPWQVALLFGSSLGAQGCGGTLVSGQHVVTAAHCTAGASPADLRVALGDTTFAVDTEATSFILNIAEIIDHPDYDPSTQENDISVLKLAEPLDLTAYPNIKPACLPAAAASFSGATALVSGWGTVGSGLPLVAWLNKVEVSVLEDCSAYSISYEDMLCASVPQGGKDSCQGDSGGPLVTSDGGNGGAYSLIGVVSWGYGCAQQGQPGVYSRVAHNRAWLDGVLAGSETCPPPDGSSPNTTAPTLGPATTGSQTTSDTTTEGSGSGIDCLEENAQPKMEKVKLPGKFQTAEECQAACQVDEGCSAFQWKLRGKRCWLVTIGYRPRDGFTSGPKFC